MRAIANGPVPFTWDDRMLELWKRFVGRHLRIVARPWHVDHANGGFCVYELREAPLPRSPAFLPIFHIRQFFH